MSVSVRTHNRLVKMFCKLTKKERAHLFKVLGPPHIPGSGPKLIWSALISADIREEELAGRKRKNRN